MAQAAAASLRHSWPWFLSRSSTASITAHLSSIFTPKSHTHSRFSHDSTLRSSSTSTATATRTHGLRRSSPSPVEADTPDDADVDSDRKSRNELKREARRAVRWGMDLAEFSTPQIECIIRAASLEREVFNALMLVKRLGHDVREGKRRQFSYIGRLLRAAEPELMDALIQASKDGDNNRLLALSGRETWPVEDHEEEQETDDDEELRKLVRQVQLIEEESLIKESVELSKAALTRVKKPLVRYLRWLAKESESLDD